VSFLRAERDGVVGMEIRFAGEQSMVVVVSIRICVRTFSVEEARARVVRRGIHEEEIGEDILIEGNSAGRARLRPVV
jgi:hypothetical protein